MFKNHFLSGFVVKCDLNMFPEIHEAMSLADLHHLNITDTAERKESVHIACI